MSRAESVEFVETPSYRMIRVLRPVVPLSKATGGVTSRFEILEDRPFVQVQSLLA
jgi:hypothetical protein